MVILTNVIIRKNNVFKDIYIAKKVISGSLKPEDFCYDDHSSIYKTTNENINHEPYIDALRNRRRVLSIIGSGDQIINAILFGAKNIVGIDISSFPKYFLSLKLAAIKTLKKEAYLNYFYGEQDVAFNLDLYELIRNELDEESRLFWDCQYNSFEPNKIYNSKLFSSFGSKKLAIRHNPFLKDNNFNELRKKIDSSSIELLNGNMFDVNKNNYDNFDLIILSNIINYVNSFFNDRLTAQEFEQKMTDSMNKYKEYLKNLPLNNGGIALTYNINFGYDIKKHFSEKEYKVYDVNEESEIYRIKNEIIIYEKPKKLIFRR